MWFYGKYSLLDSIRRGYQTLLVSFVYAEDLRSSYQPRSTTSFSSGFVSSLMSTTDFVGTDFCRHFNLPVYIRSRGLLTQ